MTFQITQVLADAVARAALQQLNYDDTPAIMLLTKLDNFLKEYVTANEVNGTEPCSKNQDEEALADIATAWLDDKGQGRLYWPCLDSSEYPGQLRYDDQDHGLIASQVEILVCALNRARHRNECEPHWCIQNSTDLPPSQKRYTAIAQAMLSSLRRGRDLWVPPRLNDHKLCRALSPLLDSTVWTTEDGSTVWTIEDSVDTLSDKLQAQLRKDRVVGPPGCFFPLQRHYSRAKQVEASAQSLGYLKEIGVISEIGQSDEERLQSVAQACGRLCFRNGFELPSGLNDMMLPDLLTKFTIMEVARKTPTAEANTR